MFVSTGALPHQGASEKMTWPTLHFPSLSVHLPEPPPLSHHICEVPARGKAVLGEVWVLSLDLSDTALTLVIIHVHTQWREAVGEVWPDLNTRKEGHR